MGVGGLEGGLGDEMGGGMGGVDEGGRGGCIPLPYMDAILR